VFPNILFLDGRSIFWKSHLIRKRRQGGSLMMSPEPKLWFWRGYWLGRAHARRLTHGMAYRLEDDATLLADDAAQDELVTEASEGDAPSSRSG
jgi:hypothetical protein